MHIMGQLTIAISADSIYLFQPRVVASGGFQPERMADLGQKEL
jgi:hypothetical protein